MIQNDQILNQLQVQIVKSMSGHSVCKKEAHLRAFLLKRVIIVNRVRDTILVYVINALLSHRKWIYVDLEPSATFLRLKFYSEFAWMTVITCIWIKICISRHLSTIHAKVAKNWKIINFLIRSERYRPVYSF